MSPKIFDNDLVAICISQLVLKVNKPAYIGMCIPELTKALIYKTIMIALKINTTANQNYYSQTLIVHCMKSKLKMLVTILAAIKKCLMSVSELKLDWSQKCIHS